MNPNRPNSMSRYLSVLLILTLFLGNVTFGSVKNGKPVLHWVKSSPGVSESWYPLVDRYAAQGRLDLPMPREDFEALIQTCFEEVFQLEALSSSSQNKVQVIPGDYITRMEAAFRLHHLMGAEKFIEKTTFTDQDQIPVWALESVNGMSQRGILKGFPDGSFKSHQWLTHAEAISLLAKSKLHWVETMPEESVAVPEVPAVTPPASEVTPPEVPQPPVTIPPVVIIPVEPVEPDQEEPKAGVPEAPDLEEPDPEPEPETEPVVTVPHQTHDGMLCVMVPESGEFRAGEVIEIYIVDEDLNTDPNVRETAELVLEINGFEVGVYLLYEISEDSDVFMAHFTPLMEYSETPYTFQINDYYYTMVHFYYMEAFDASGNQNVYHPAVFDILPPLDWEYNWLW